MTNKIEGGKLSIMKCPDCTDGYLIVKNARERECFLGCTNYKKNNTGCNHVIWKNQYYKMKYNEISNFFEGKFRHMDDAT